MKKNEEQHIKKAILYQNKNWHKRALKILHVLETNNKSVSYLFGLIASSYYQLKDFKTSAKYFKKTTELNSKSELASLGLFHSLMELGKETSALKEIERYTRSYPSKLYNTTIEELKERQDDFSKIQKKIINELQVNIK